MTAGQASQAGVAAGADAVLDPGVGAVAGVEEGVLAGPGVRGQSGVAVAVTLFDQIECAPGCGRSLRTIIRVPDG